MSPRHKSSIDPSFKTVFPCPGGPGVPSPGLETIARPSGSTVVNENSIQLLSYKTKLLYHINRITGNLRLYIPPEVAPDVLQIAHREGHPGFSRCYKIIIRSWYIWSLTRLLREFIWHCPQYLQLQTRRHRPYEFLQPIESSPVPFFILTLDFVLALLLTKPGFNVIMSVTCKFLKQVILIEGVDTWSAEQ